MQSRLAAGDLFQRVTIESATVSQDAAGQPIRSWSTLASDLPAQVEQVTGGETIRGRQVSAETTLLVTIRWRSDLTPEMRLTYESRTYGIVRVHDPYGDRREIRIESKEAR